MSDNYPWQGIYDELGVSVPELDDRTLGFWVTKHGRELADNTALQYFDREISYRELDELSNQLANALTALGVTKGDVVGLHMPNIPQYVIGLVAISKLGCTGSGVSPLLMPAEMSHQIKDAGITTLISLDALANSVLPQLPEVPSCFKTLIVAGAADSWRPLTSLSPTSMVSTARVTCRSSKARQTSSRHSRRTGTILS